MPINTQAIYWRVQAKDNSGGVHPTGWLANQLYSATAAQWQNMFNAEVALYNGEVTAYNGMVSQRDIWQSRANSAWGASRVWNSGESWEQAYTRVYTDRYNQGYSDGQTSVQPAALWSPTTGQGGVLTAPYNGQYVLSLHAVVPGGDNCGDVNGNVHIYVNGSPVSTGTFNDWCDTGLTVLPTYYAAGTQFSSNGSVGSGRSFSSFTFSATFIPVPGYPH